MTIRRSIQRCLMILALCISCYAINGCVESDFDLATESRLPRWFALQPGLTRADVSLEMTYYTLGDVKFVLRDKNRRVLAKLKGKVRDTHPLLLLQPQPGSDAFYPSYAVVTIKGITEIMEHRKPEPIFYILDDPAVRKDLLAGRFRFH